MADKQWPERGQMSEDGKCYTHTDGSVHKLWRSFVSCAECSICYLVGACAVADCHGGHYEQIEGAYVPSSDQRVAEAAMRAMIAMCPGRDKDLNTCHGKGCFDLQTCPLRRYLSDELHDPKAWEV